MLPDFFAGDCVEAINRVLVVVIAERVKFAVANGDSRKAGADVGPPDDGGPPAGQVSRQRVSFEMSLWSGPRQHGLGGGYRGGEREQRDKSGQSHGGFHGDPGGTLLLYGPSPRMLVILASVEPSGRRVRNLKARRPDGSTLAFSLSHPRNSPPHCRGVPTGRG